MIDKTSSLKKIPKEINFDEKLRLGLINELMHNKKLNKDDIFLVAQMLGSKKMKKEIQKILKMDPNFTIRDEANAITAYAFRNGFLEDLHAGKHSKILEDDKYSRITQEEMKKLMIEASAKIEDLMLMKKHSPKEYQAFIIGYNKTYCSQWDRSKKRYNIKKD